MIQFPNKEEKLRKRDELIAQAEELLETVDPNAVERMVDRCYLGETENDNKLLQHADREHMKRQIEAMKLLFKAGKYNND